MYKGIVLKIIYQLAGMMLLATYPLSAQENGANLIENYVNNPSFEDIVECPDTYGSIDDAIGWLALNFTPDLFHECAPNPIVGSPENYFGNQAPSEGRGYAGLLAYHDKSPKEFIATYLVEPLKTGEKYEISFKIAWARVYSNYACSDLGILFTNDLENSIKETRPDILVDDIVTNTEWQTISKIITVDDDYEFIVIGNFSDKESMKIYQFQKTGYDGAYYYIDEIKVRKFEEKAVGSDFIKVTGQVYNEETLKPIPARIDFILPEINYRAFEEADSTSGYYEFSNMQRADYFYLEVKSEGFFSKRILVSNDIDDVIKRSFYLKPSKVGSRIVLDYLSFDSGSAEINEESFPYLDLLANFLQENPEYKIEVSGHTDNQGDSQQNLALSGARAKAVVSYLIEQGFISPKRLSYKGFGSSQALVDNDNEENRKKNRRVEIKIVD